MEKPDYKKQIEGRQNTNS